VHGATRLGHALRVELALGYSPIRAHPLPGDRTVEVGFDLAFAALAGCALTGVGTELGVCLRVQAGAMRGHGDELSDGHDGALPHVAFALGPLLMQALGDVLVLRFELAASLTAVRPQFQLDTGALVYEPEILGFTAALGGELRFD
jgi:hypothetical protein